MHTRGDKILDKPLVDFGGKGVFITEFEEALMSGTIDFAVHSSKDMPMELAEGLVIAGVLPRADARDVLVTRKLGNVNKYNRGDFSPLSNMVIGTGSLRRQFQLKLLCPNVKCISIRGNVPTRLQKIREGMCDGVILAAAGLERLGLLNESDFEYHFFSYDDMIPAGGQGIIAVESKNIATGDMLRNISDKNTELELETERSILKYLEAGCHEAVGVFSKVENGRIDIRIIHEKDGTLYRKQGSSEVKDRMILAEELAKGIASNDL
jgi:hydroxymethylbilane synthase